MIPDFHEPNGRPTPLSNFWRGSDVYLDLRPLSDINIWPTAERAECRDTR